MEAFLRIRAAAATFTTALAAFSMAGIGCLITFLTFLSKLFKNFVILILIRTVEVYNLVSNLSVLQFTTQSLRHSEEFAC